MADNSSSAMSGGLLVILGIIVALALGYFFYHGRMNDTATISVTVPNTTP